MTFGEIYRSLSSEPWWAAQSRAMRVLAARYYAGIDSFAQLLAQSEHQPTYRDVVLAPALSAEQVDTIRMLR